MQGMQTLGHPCGGWDETAGRKKNLGLSTQFKYNISGGPTSELINFSSNYLLFNFITRYLTS